VTGSRTSYRYGLRDLTVYPVTGTELLALAQGLPWTRRAMVRSIMGSTSLPAENSASQSTEGSELLPPDESIPQPNPKGEG
jgi:hypothetical protein